MSKPILITTTSDDRTELESIAAQLIELNLAACCQIIGPIKSVYRWEGKVQQSEEWLCSIKTIETHFSEVAATIAKLHHYDTPEIIGQELTKVSDPYLNWLRREVAG